MHKISEKAKTFLVNQGINTPAQMAILATSEGEVKKEILEHMIAGQVDFPLLSDKTAVSLLWKACKDMGAKDAALEDSGVASDSPIKKEVKEDLEIVWFKAHGFLIPDEWLMVATVQG